MTSYGSHFKTENHTSENHRCLGDHVTHGSASVQGSFDVSGETTLKNTVHVGTFENNDGVIQLNGPLRLSGGLMDNQINKHSINGLLNDHEFYQQVIFDAPNSHYDPSNPGDSWVRYSIGPVGDEDTTNGNKLLVAVGSVDNPPDDENTEAVNPRAIAVFNPNRSTDWSSNMTILGSVTASSVVQTSDDRFKNNEELVTQATDTIKKLKPQIYNKTVGDESFRESGLIAQEVWYNAPELRHLVHLGRDKDESTPTPGDMDLSGIEPGTDPDYGSNGWSTHEPSGLNYTGLIAYLVKSNQELAARLDALELK